MLTDVEPVHILTSYFLKVQDRIQWWVFVNMAMKLQVL